MPISLDESYNYCRQVARSRAKNFYYSFLLLEKPQRDAMCAVYTFNRYCDDLSDEPAERRAGAFARKGRAMACRARPCVAGDYSENTLWPAFHDTVQRYNIPHRFFHEMIDGISSDLEPRQIRTFDELYRYCYQVASVVGLTIIHIFGFDSVKALLLAEKSGIAFQLTNIIRDVREDAQLGRIYLPLEDLDRFGVPSQPIEGRAEKTMPSVGFSSSRATRAQRYL